jgi:hypothetical protein
MFVVLGPESSGKSTLLERVSMFNMFPRGEGICTRMAIKVELRRTAVAAPPELQVVDLKTQEPMGKKRIVTLVAGSLDVSAAMEEAIREEHSGLVGVSQSRMLVLRVHSPTVPSLDLVDLPGLVSVENHDEEGHDMPAQTTKLLSSFISEHKEHAVFLVVLPATTPPRTSPVLKLVKDHKIESQTIGVFTKCDNAADKVIKKDVKHLVLGKSKDAIGLEPYGWLVTMNAPVDDEEGNELPAPERLRQQGEEEVSWLHQRLPAAEMAEKLGCNALIDKMRSCFHEYVKRTWAPAAIFRLEGESARLRAADAALGLPAAHTELAPGQLSQLQEAAIGAAERVLSEQITTSVRAAHKRAAALFKARAAVHSPPDGLADIGAWAASWRREVMEHTTQALREAASGVRDALAQDSSSFKLGRFPAFLDSVTEALHQALDRILTGDVYADLDGPGAVRDLLKHATAATPSSGWIESTVRIATSTDAPPLVGTLQATCLDAYCGGLRSFSFAGGGAAATRCAGTDGQSCEGAHCRAARRDRRGYHLAQPRSARP